MADGEDTCGGGEDLAEARAVVVARLRARRGEIEQAVFTRVREAVPDLGTGAENYVQGLRVAVAAAVEFGLSGLVSREGFVSEIPVQAVAQAHLAARSGVSLDAVLRRYIVGHALLWDYVMEEADRLEGAGRDSGLREMSRAQTSLLDRLVIGVTQEHAAESKRAGRSREHRLLERVRLLLADTHPAALADAQSSDLDLDYDLEGEHLAVIVRGTGAEQALRDLAKQLDRRLLWVSPGEDTLWAWLGGRSAPASAHVAAALYAEPGARSAANVGRGASAAAGTGESERSDRQGGSGAVARGPAFAMGERARGLEGWRTTHQQAQAALLVALREPRRLTRYADVALLAAALGDELLARTLREIYLSPLEDARHGGPVLRQTLRAYIAAEHNASSAAAALGVARSTVEGRLRSAEERLQRSLRPCPPELEVALRLAELVRSDCEIDSSTEQVFT